MVLAGACLAFLVWTLAGYRVHDVLTPRHLQNAVFGPAPVLPGAFATTQELIGRVRAHDGASLVEPLVPTQSGVLWLFALLVCLVGSDASGDGRARRARPRGHAGARTPAV